MSLKTTASLPIVTNNGQNVKSMNRLVFSSNFHFSELPDGKKRHHKKRYCRKQNAVIQVDDADKKQERQQDSEATHANVYENFAGLFLKQRKQQNQLPQKWQHGKRMQHGKRVGKNFGKNFRLHLKQKHLLALSPLQVTKQRSNN